MSVNVIMLLWLSDDRKLCACAQLTCVGCAASISQLVRVSTIKSPPAATWVRHAQYSYFSRPLTFFLNENSDHCHLFVTSLNTGNHEAITRPFLFHSKASPNFYEFDNQFDYGSLRVSASRNFKQRKDIEWTSNGTGPKLDNYWWLTIDMEWSCNYHSRMCLSYVTWCHNMGPET